MTDLEYRMYVMKRQRNMRRGMPISRAEVMKRRVAEATTQQLDFVKQYLADAQVEEDLDYLDEAYDTKACEWHLFSDDDEECMAKFYELKQAVRECK